MNWKKQIPALVISVVLLATFSGIMSAVDADDSENATDNVLGTYDKDGELVSIPSNNSGRSLSPTIDEEKITDGAISKGISIASTALQPGWPRTTGDDVPYSSPALGDIDGDGDIEIVVGSRDNKVYAWHHEGTLVTGWPQITGGDVYSSPALGDIDGDGDIEIVVGSKDNKVYAWHHDGALVTGWPQITGSDDVCSSPALGDIDGDGDIEIVVGSYDDKVYAWHHEGTLVTGWPQITGDDVDSSPALGDIDGDGDIEVVVGSDDNKVYAWDCSGTYDPGNIEWGTFHHDVKRTGLYAPLPSVPKVISVVTDKTNYTLSETVYVTLEINYSAEYPVVTVLELELKEPCDTPDLLYKSPWFIMMPPVFQWNATVPIYINDSMWVSGGGHSFIATLIEPTIGRVIWKDSACFKIEDLPEKKRVELEIP